MIDAETKKQFDAFMKMNGGMENFASGIGNMLAPFMEEQRKLLVPKSKKDVKINGVSCAKSLISDGRVVISFPTMDHATAYFNDEIIEGYDRIIESLQKQLAEEKAKTWFQKLLGK